MTSRQLTTILALLRDGAQQHRRLHGPLVETPGGIYLTPTEMEQWANELEAAGSDEDWLTA